MAPKDFTNETPHFAPEVYFLGHTRGSGVFYDRFGDLKRRFVIDLHGEMRDGVFFLNENLKYSDGETLSRHYEFHKINEHLYEATAEGIVGKATIEAYGNALRWTYKLQQPINGSIWTLSFDDWMFLQDTGIVLNRAKAYKFGIFLGEVMMAVERLNE